VIAVDTSVAVAAFGSWHEEHRSAVRAVARGARLLGPVAVETYAVLTRLPLPHRAPPELVVEFLTGNFPQPILTLPPREHPRLLASCSRLGVTGGGIYDALVAATAKHAGATLLTLDRRARPVYEAMGAEARYMGSP